MGALDARALAVRLVPAPLPQARTSGSAQQHPSAETGGTLRGVILGKTQLNPAQSPGEQVGLGGAAERRVAGEGQETHCLDSGLS